jgi:hypothetical protein
MGMDKMKRMFLFIGLIVFSWNAFSEESPLSFSTGSWPVAGLSCTACIPFQFDQLGLQIPRTKLLGIHVLHMDKPAVSLLYQSNSPDEAKNISLLLMDDRKATGGLREKGFFKRLSVDTLQQFFISLGRSNADKQALDLSREILGIHEASEYMTITGQSASAFWIKSRDFDNQRLYIVEKDSNYAYQIAGPLTDEIVYDLLSYARFK